MKKLTFGFLFLVLFAFSAVDGQKWNSNGRTSNGRKAGRTGSYGSEEINGGRPSDLSGVSKAQPVKPPARRGIGAWGYISIILFAILTGLGVYYTIIFYPIVCKKQRMYHVMGSTTV